MDDANAMIERLIDALVWVLPGLLLLLLVILVLSYTDRQRRRNGNSDKQA
jgi:cytochrome c-type biogenesis protein CcmH/NrfF